jgi:iron(III) transport system substrate-binding protein
LIAFLVSDDAQALYAAANHEYPVSRKVQPSAVVQSWGKLTPDTLALDNISKWRQKASELADKVNFDAGPGS